MPDMQSSATDVSVVWRVDNVSVCLRRAKSAVRIEVLFVLETPRSIVSECVDLYSA